MQHIQMGTFGKGKSKDWTLLEGKGPRQFEQYIEFEPRMPNVPQVHVGISCFDIIEGTNQRLKVYARDVTCEGFVLVFETWANTRVYHVEANWLAIAWVTCSIASSPIRQ